MDNCLHYSDIGVISSLDHLSSEGCEIMWLLPLKKGVITLHLFIRNGG
ncbi:MAG: hypothetical protein WCW03_02855 [Candidatus Paceibacterota bacterium]